MVIILVVFFWLISYTAGIICITLAAINFRRSPDDELKSVLFLLAAISAAIIPLTLKSAVENSSLLWTIRSVHYQALVVSLTLISQLGLCLLIGAFPLLAHALLQKGHGAVDQILLYIPTAMGTVLTADIILFSIYGTDPFGIVSIWITVGILILFPAAVLYALFSILLGRKSTKNRSSALALCFSGVMLLLTVFEREYPGSDPGIASVLTDYLIPGTYLLLNGFLLTRLLKKLTAPTSPDLNSALLKKMRITPREEEVINHLVTGASYKEIGGLLRISLPTVQSHISRIYQKAGVRSKVELLRLLTGH